MKLNQEEFSQIITFSDCLTKIRIISQKASPLYLTIKKTKYKDGFRNFDRIIKFIAEYQIQADCGSRITKFEKSTYMMKIKITQNSTDYISKCWNVDLPLSWSELDESSAFGSLGWPFKAPPLPSFITPFLLLLLLVKCLVLLILLTAIEPIACKEFTGGSLLLFVVGVLLIFMGKVTQLPEPTMPVVSSMSSPVCRCSHAFLRWRTG